MKLMSIKKCAVVVCAFLVAAFSSAHADPCESLGEVCEPATTQEMVDKDWLPAVRVKTIGSQHPTSIRLKNRAVSRKVGKEVFGKWSGSGNSYEKSDGDSCHQFETTLFYEMTLVESLQFVNVDGGGKALKVSREVKPTMIPESLEYQTYKSGRTKCLDHDTVKLTYNSEIEDFDHETYKWEDIVPATPDAYFGVNYLSDISGNYSNGTSLNFKVFNKRSRTKIKKSWPEFIREKMSEAVTAEETRVVKSTSQWTADQEVTETVSVPSPTTLMDDFIQVSSARASKVYINIERNKLFIFPSRDMVGTVEPYVMKLRGYSYPATSGISFSRNHYQEAEIMLSYLKALKNRMQYRIYEPTYGVMEEALERILVLDAEGRSVLSSRLAQEMMAIILLADHVIDADLQEDMLVKNRAAIVSRLIQRIDNIKVHYTTDDVANVGTYFAATVSGSLRRTTDEMIKEMLRDQDKAKVAQAIAGLDRVNQLAESIEVAQSWGDGDVENSRVLDELITAGEEVLRDYESTYSLYDDDQGLSAKFERALNVLGRLRRGHDYSVLNLARPN